MNPEFGKMLNAFKKKAVEIGKVVKEDALSGAQMGKHKVKELDLERQKLAKLYEVGKKALAWHKKGELAQADLKELCGQIVLMEKEISKQKSAFTVQKKKLKKLPLK
ncbi:MAG: hypothetical protein HY920_06570 [Elusimicrobia bacterium]|nr:hypothetical protein [Elusimicrobiota bacterium]